MSAPPFGSVLVANRGEIAVRVIRTLRRLGIRAIAVHSDADAAAPHVRLADEAFAIGPPPARDSYLRVEAVVEAARRAGAEALHPGYGFLSERPELARACEAAGIAFVGPPAEAIELLGDKAAARRLAERAGVRVVPGLGAARLGDEEIVAWAREDPSRLPVMVKAAAGGGGRGLRVVRTLDELPGALAAARREALAAFGDGALLVERHVQPARHVEVQLLADAHGAALALGERECSLQRRHQKLVEESPAPGIPAAARERMAGAAVALGRAAGYVGAGTCEFLVPADDPEQPLFLEVNARLQVEHPVTELVLGLDLVEAQLRLAAGEPLWLSQHDLRPRGHAIEARVCAEDPGRGFLPGTGRIVAYREPEGPGVRVDSGVEAGTVVSAHYDSLLCKVTAHAPDRATALARLDAALAELALLGPTVNTAFLRRLLAHPAVRAVRLDVGLVERLGAVADAGCGADEAARELAAIVAALARVRADRADEGDDPWECLRGWRLHGRAAVRVRLVSEAGGDAVEIELGSGSVRVGDGPPRTVCAEPASAGLAVTIDGHRRRWACARDGELTRVGIDGRAWAFREQPRALRSRAAAAGATLQAPMPGSVLDVRVRTGEAVRAGDVLVVLESMKMELELTAPHAGTVTALEVAPGDRVGGGQLLVALAQEAA